MGFDCWCNINIHVGWVVTGSFGSLGREQFDVLGKAVNADARLGLLGVMISPKVLGLYRQGLIIVVKTSRDP